MKGSFISQTPAASYNASFEQKVEALGQCQPLYWDSLITLGLFVLVLLVLL